MAQYEQTPIDWREALQQDDTWYGNDEALRIADNVLMYQHSTGGWPKNINMARILTEQEMVDVRHMKLESTTTIGRPTIDNGATHTQLRFLAKVYQQTGKTRYREGFLKGVDYLLEAQYDNGGWPQYYPLRKGYYEDITFNDGAMIGVMLVLRDIAQGNFHFVDSSRIREARQAIEKGLAVILQTQIEVDSELTAWCAQYHPVTLAPCGARSYEPPSISGAESVGVVKYLMGIENPSDVIVASVTSAVEWFDSVKLTGLRVIRKKDASLPRGFDVIVVPDPASDDPLWARFYEIGTNTPMFIDRDGVIKYSLSEIGHERRVGYRWLGDWARDLIDHAYPAWLESCCTRE